MASLSIRDLDDGVRDRLKIRAAANGRSMEAEVRAILSDALGAQDRSAGLLGALSARVTAVGGVELELPPRAERPRAADLS
ncbi:MAG: Arc family DNA-binding protein [Solirubrobacteraceae bacterium]|nr:Arc family DNA-binding protein [Solirubrobacteraceae bacterium]